MRHLPIRAADTDNAQDAPSDALGGAQDSLWQSFTAPFAYQSLAAIAGSTTPATSESAPAVLASLTNPAAGSFGASITDASIGPNGATAAQVQQALDQSGLSVNGSGIKVGVLSDSFNNLGGAAADEADGALPSAANIQVLKDLASGGTDEGRAMMQIIHDIAPGASLAFYTAFDGEQDFANGILALAAAGCKVIVDDVSYFDEPFFQNGVIAQAIQTVEAEGVTYVTAAGNEGSNAYQAAWTPMSGSYEGVTFTDAENFSGSLVQTIVLTASTTETVPLLLEWNQAYGAATSDLEILVFHNGSLYGTATNVTSGEPTNPWVDFTFTASGTYQIAIENLSGPDPGLIKYITEGDGLPVDIIGANTGTVFGHAMTPGAISTGAVSAAGTPAFGVNPAQSESFSSSGAGTELLFANNGTPLSSPDVLSPVAVSGIDGINTTVPGDLSDFFGTSAASASLAGVAALILSADPNLTPAQVEQIMEQTALPMANSAVSGAGLVQVDPAVADALAAAFPGAELGLISATLLTQGDVENNSTTDLVWRASNAQTTVWAIDTSGNLTSTSLGVIGSTWTILNSGDYVSSSTTQMLTDYTPNGTATLWWVNNGVLTGIDLGVYWQGNTYVASGNFTSSGSDDILVKNQASGGMYVWWYNPGTQTLNGINLGIHWANIGFVATGTFLANGVTNFLVKNQVDNHMYDWWVNPATLALNGNDLGAVLAGNSVVATGNFLANGSDDMLIKNAATNGMYVWWIDPTSHALKGINLGNDWTNTQYLTSGHFAGSGDEMLVRNTTNNHVSMWWVNSQNALVGVDLGLISPQWHVVATADYNGDGFTDIVWQNSSSGQVQLWLMGSFSAPSSSTFASTGSGSGSESPAAKPSPAASLGIFDSFSSTNSSGGSPGNFGTPLASSLGGSPSYTPYSSNQTATFASHAASVGEAAGYTPDSQHQLFALGGSASVPRI